MPKIAATIAARPLRVAGGMLALALVALAAPFAGAGRAGPVDSEKPATSGEPEKPAAPQKPESPHRGGILRLAFEHDWRSLDPAVAFDGDSVPLQKCLFRGLIDFDAGTNLVPDQASDWNVSPDGKTYTFHLKPHVRFSNGREVEAADYVCALERVIDPKTASECQPYFMDVVGAKEFRDAKSKDPHAAVHVAGLHAPDPLTFVVQLKGPVYTFRYVMAMNAADVVPRDLVEKYGDDFQYHMEGTGPYRIAEWRRGIGYRIERNRYYSGPDAFIDGMDIRIGPDPSTRLMMLECGEVDLCRAPAPDLPRYLRDPGRRSWLHTIDQVTTDYFFMNTEMKPFDDVRVRRAASYAIDVRRQVGLNRGNGVEARGIVPPPMPWSNPDLPRHEYDPEKAQTLLREAGLPDGFRTQLWFPVENAVYKRLAQGVQQDLGRVGIDVELKGVAQEAFLVRSGSHRQAACGVSGWGQDYPDPSDFLDILFNGERITDSGCNNLPFYNNPKVNALLDQAGGSIDVPFRTRLFREAEDIIMGDAPWVPLLHEQLPVLKTPRLHGLQGHPVWVYRYENMWLDR